MIMNNEPLIFRHHHQSYRHRHEHGKVKAWCRRLVARMMISVRIGVTRTCPCDAS
jgi:hypothetical protein